MAPVYCLARRLADKFSRPAMHHFGTPLPPRAPRKDEKKAHHAVRSNLPRFRLLGSASNIL
jgi:hypothetical protein